MQTHVSNPIVDDLRYRNVSVLIDTNPSLSGDLQTHFQACGLNVRVLNGRRKHSQESVRHHLYPNVLIFDQSATQKYGDSGVYRSLPKLLLTDAEMRLTDVLSLHGFESDFMMLPVQFPELLARIWQLTCRHVESVRSEDEEIVLNEHVTINLASRQVSNRDHVHKLSPTETAILILLHRRSGVPVRTAEILNWAWPPGKQGTLNSLRAHVRRIRRKIERDPDNPQYLVTTYANGYALTI